ncbi:MAG: hypothetical protein JXR76_04830 [Deltaproteobacteria bacterium]|nr:hypothetical protein [Deltaproteobacteria bacterium]
MMKINQCLKLWAMIITMWAAYGVASPVLAQDTNRAKPESETNAVSVIVEDNQVFMIKGKEKTPLPLAGLAYAIYRQDDVLYVAVGSMGVQVFKLEDASATLIRHIPTPNGNAVGFFVSGNRLWVETRTTSATVLEDAHEVKTHIALAPVSGNMDSSIAGGNGASSKKNAAASAVAISSKKKAHPLNTRTESISVTDTFPGEVKLNVGTNDGVQLKDRFEIYRDVTVQGGGETFTGKELVAMVEITAVNKTSCIGKLPRGDRAKAGDEAAYVKKGIAKRNTFPQKLSRIGNVGFTVRPILNLAGNSGGGALFDLDLSWLGKHTFMAFRVKPMAIGGTKESSIFNSMVLAEGGYDGRAFAVGLGVGAGLTNGRMNATIGDNWMDDATDNAKKKDPHRAAFALSQFIRLGPMDGLNLTINNAFLFASISQADSDEEGFEYGSTSAQLTIPLGYRVNLFMGGGGGRLGHAYGEIGVLAWLRGNGDAGSISVSGAVGAAGAWVIGRNLDNSGYAEETFMAGPMVSFGMNYRFGSKSE